jgi:glycine cleavage system transcriptional repressor
MSGKEYLVLSAVGADRPGLVERISTLIHVSGANLEDSRMAILGGEFALILLVSGHAEALSSVERGGPQLEQELELRISFKPTERKGPTPDYLPYKLRVSGIDRPGIVSHVSGVLAKRAINVAAFDSRLTYAPLSGTPLFHLHARLQVPSEVALASLRADVTRLCEEENLDFLLETDDAE